MQHHTHATRGPPPHMRSAHTNNIQIHPAPVLTAQAAVATVTAPLPTQQQHQPKVPPTAAIATASSSANVVATVPQSTNAAVVPQHMHQQNNRSTNTKHLHTTIPPTQSPNTSTQMHKFRQQNQHLNKISHNNHSPQHYNHINASQPTHMGALQQQQQQHPSAQHPQQLKPHFNAHQLKNRMLTATGLPPQQPQLQQQPTAMLKQMLPATNMQLQQLQQQQQQYNYAHAGNKIKYNNNNNNNNNINTTTTSYVTPKMILHNPNRTPKPTQQLHASSATSIVLSDAGTPDVVATSTPNSSSNNVSNVPDIAATSMATHVTDNADDNEEGASNEVDAVNTTNSNDTSNEHRGKHFLNNILPNTDPIAGKHGKEKTPMCLVNELARYNKITHQYRLTSEKGPAHCKRFTVTLKLGDEEYTAEGFKIKKAQHLAASQAMEKTAYKHPAPKFCRNFEDTGRPRPYIMPTVELNALAMKLGQQTYYLFDPRQMPPTELAAPDGPPMSAQHYGNPRPPLPPPAAHSNGGGGGGHILPPPQTHPHSRILQDATYPPRRHHMDATHGGTYALPPPHLQHHAQHQRPYLPYRNYPPSMHRYHHQSPRYPMLAPPPPPPPPGLSPVAAYYGVQPTPCKITLIVGKQKFVGVGRTVQQAKHDAAARALQVLKMQQSTQQAEDELNDSLEETDAKSPISQVFEAGIKRNWTVHFKVLREEGPAHMRNFITACIMGNLMTEGEGHGKKISKKRAAEKMLAELSKLPPMTPPPVKSPVKRIKSKSSGKATLMTPNSKPNAAAGSAKKRSERGSVKDRDKENNPSNNNNNNEAEDETAVTKLIQLLQNRKEKEPVFEFIAKHGNERLKHREFIVEVTACGMAARGTGSSKKLAKRKAAENLLAALTETGNVNSFSTIADGQETAPTTTKPEQIKATQPAIVPRRTPPSTATENSLEAIDIPLVSTSAGQVPGILILRQNKKGAIKKKEKPLATDDSKAAKNDVPKQVEVASVPQTTIITEETVPPASTVAVEPTTIASTTATVVSTATVVAPVADTANTSTTNTTVATATATTTASSSGSNTNTTTNTTTSSGSSSSSAPPMMKHQLLYLAKLLGFEVNFSDYPKGNHNEFLTIVALSTDPPQICHGFGTNTDESQNDAARNALKILSDLGLNNAKSN